MENIQPVQAHQKFEIAPIEVLKVCNLTEKKQAKTWLKRDIVLNIGLKESFIRFFIMLFLPWPFLAINHNLIIYIAPIEFYLEVTAMVHYCPIKVFLDKYFKKKIMPEVCNLSLELNVPVRTI